MGTPFSWLWDASWKALLTSVRDLWHFLDLLQPRPKPEPEFVTFETLLLLVFPWLVSAISVGLFSEL